MKFNKGYNYTEFYKLAVTLIARGYTIEVSNLYDGKQISVYKQDENDDTKKDFQWDATINNYSYGHEHGLLEVYGNIVRKFTLDDTVFGSLTADEIIQKCPPLDTSPF